MGLINPMMLSKEAQLFGHV